MKLLLCLLIALAAPPLLASDDYMIVGGSVVKNGRVFKVNEVQEMDFIVSQVGQPNSMFTRERLLEIFDRILKEQEAASGKVMELEIMQSLGQGIYLAFNNDLDTVALHTSAEYADGDDVKLRLRELEGFLNYTTVTGANARVRQYAVVTTDLTRDEFVERLKAGEVFKVSLIDKIDVDKVRGRADKGQDPDKRYWPENYPNGYKLVRTNYAVRWQ